MKAHAQALKNKLVSKAGDVLSAPARSRARNSKRTSDYEVDIIKKNRNAGRSRHASQGAVKPGDPRHTRAEYQRIREKHGR